MLLLTVLSLLFFVGSFKKSLFAYLFLLFAAVSFGIGVLHHNNDFLNFAKIVRCQEGMDQKKIFCFKNLRLDGSYGSNIQRIDVIDTKTPYIKYVLYDGLINDHITTHTTANYVFDRRVITGLVDKPNIFIIGTAAEGILRPTVAQQGTVDGVEINKAIMKIMRGPYYDFTKKIYDDIDEFHVADGRSFLKGSTQGKTYDMITLINTHMMRTAGHFGPPEYLHSKEALNEFLNRLSANGYLVFEERNAHEQAEQGVLRIVATIIKALEERGIDNPLDHIFVYDWYGNRSRNRGNLYTNILVKKTPLNDQDWKAINVWAYSLGIYEERKEIIALHPTDVVHPEFQNTEETSSFIPRLNTLLDEYASNGIIPSIIDGVSIEPITDDRPYPWISIESTKLLQRKLLISALVCGGVLLAMLLFFCLFDRSLFRRSMYPFTSYFALLGLGYMIIEIGLLNFYQMFLGSPTYSLVFVLGTLLLSSGIGSLLSGKYSKGKAVIILMSLILLCLYHMLVNRQLISSISSVHALTIILVTLSIVPLGFCMGLPFPYGIEALKKKVSDKYTSLMFGINVVFGAFATMLGMYLSVIVGFQATFFVGILCYIVAFLIFRKWVAN